jgi:dolichol kinase
MSAVRDVLVAAAAGGGFLGLVGTAELVRRSTRASAEATRKLVHVSGGLACLALPFLIDSHWVVLGLALALSTLFWVAHHRGRLRSLHGVERTSRGVEYFPIVVYALFVLTDGQPWLYVCALLTLAVSDALAALIGTRYGRLRYEVDGDSKSLEGSLAFLVATFLVVELPLVLWDDPSLPPTASRVLAALLTAALVTGFEAVSLAGRDNLWVPLGTYFVLAKILRQPFDEIVAQNVSLGVIALAIGLSAAWAHTFNVGGGILFVLWAYACWSLGSFDWALPVFTGFVAFLALRPLSRTIAPAKVRAVLFALLPPIVLLLAANLSLATRWSDAYPFLYGPFLAAGVLVLVQLAWSRLLGRWRFHGGRRTLFALGTSMAFAATVALPAWLVQEDVALHPLLVVLAIALAGGFAFDRTLDHDPSSAPPRRPRANIAITSGAAIVALLIQALGLAPSWNPQ